MPKKVIILNIIVAVLVVGGIAYFLLRIPSAPESVTPTPPTAEAKVFRAPLSTTSIPEDQAPPLKLYDPLLEAWFEGWDKLYYEFAYPEDEFSISTSDDNREIIIEEKQTGRIHTITIYYEGGRGFTPRDYWEVENPCPDCQQIPNPISIEGAQNLITFANKEKKWIIFQGPKPSGTVWLFVAEILRPADLVESVLSTFTFIQPQIELYQEIYPPPQPFIVRAYMSQYDKPGKVGIAWGFQGMQESRVAYTVRAYWALTPDGPWTKLADIKSVPATVYFDPPPTQEEKVYYRIVIVSSKDAKESKPSQIVEGKATCCWKVEF